jgi:LPXTG-motif cell wall-anchored protein
VLPGTEQTPTSPTVLPVTAVTDTPAPAVAVLGETLVAGAELPRTGAGQIEALMTLALSLIAAGTGLLVGFRRRVGSAVSPG